MPASAWLGSVQRYGYFPDFVNTTFSAADFPAPMSGVFFPAILKL